MLFKFVRKEKKDRQGDQLCAEIRRLELLLNQTLDFQTLKTLLDVYSVNVTQRAIEHYEAARDKLYKKLWERMQKLLLRKDVQRLIKRPHDSPRPPAHLKNGPLRGNQALPFNTPTAGEEASWAARVTIEEQAELAGMCAPSTFSLENIRKSSTEADSLIESDLNLSATTAKKLHDDIISQQENLSGRLVARIKKMSMSKASSPIKEAGDGSELSGLMGESDESAGPSKNLKADEFEEELEVVLEKHIIEKAERLDAINKKYEEQIQEMEKTGSSGIIAKVIEQMRMAQEREVMEAVQELEANRKREVAVLRRHMFQRQVVY